VRSTIAAITERIAVVMKPRPMTDKIQPSPTREESRRVEMMAPVIQRRRSSGRTIPRRDMVI
jgi:hypothetical protein